MQTQWQVRVDNQNNASSLEYYKIHFFHDRMQIVRQDVLNTFTLTIIAFLFVECTHRENTKQDKTKKQANPKPLWKNANLK